MSAGLQIFISFSSSDQHDVRSFFSALQLQGIDCWDYSAAGQELPLGELVQQSLREKIDACDYFLAIISRSTTDEIVGRFTRFELQYAISRGLLERRRILPVLLVADPPTEWSGAYKELESLRWLELDATDPKSFDERIADICAKMGVPYVAPSLRDPRVFFSKYLLQEAEQLELKNSEFIQLMRIMNRCAEEVANNRWLIAKELISAFIQLSSLLLHRIQLTYPLIVKGVCELELGEFSNAEETFTRATQAGGPSAEYFAGLGYAGLGHAFFHQERFDKALASFNRALQFLHVDKNVEFNILSSLIQANGGVDASIVNDAMLNDIGPTLLTADDNSNVSKLRGVLHYKRGDYHAAIDAFRAIDGALDEVSAIYLSWSYKSIGDEAEALQILKASASHLESTNLYHHLASAYLSIGYINEGINIYERMLCQPDRRTRQYLVEYARILTATRGSKMKEKVRELCAVVLDLRSFANSCLGAEDFFYMGFANYLLGRHELARYEFDRSHGFCDKYYDDQAFRLR